ncbi:putative leucine-rich repeat-containing protein DDB_G0290503 [Battus philenor]|uniref:putative leucine-rich repeat-containing protein DDB_G0290503 n=1 Tax=Battus philenor TaxID=42288 RepID=UPI0035D09700
MNRENIKEIIGNFSQASKDKDLSKLVVNELKRGSEVIGDKLATPVSNITFTPENDTLTAMAFIAGNLLSKLWQIEKDSSHESIETEMLKHEKISDLLELFKEPLTMRQEVFIKNALERLSKAINKDSKIKNISLCEALVPTEANNTSNENLSRTDNKCKGKILEKNKTTNAKKENSTIQAITKINSVLNLINKYENIQKHLHLLRSSILSSSDRDQNSKENVDMNLSDNENKSLNVFGNLLEKITKLILPKKSKKAKSLTTQIRHLNLFGNSKDIQDELKNIIGIDGDNVTLTTKDKLVIDYLNIFKTNPSCAMKETLQNKANSFPNISGNVLDNITKLLKIKSLNDLAELMPNTSKQSFEHQSLLHAKEKSHTTEPIYIKSNKTEEDLLLKNAKDKLRNHLNAILDDLVELQNYNGFPNKANNKSIANILPCIYSLFNSDNNSNEISPSKESSFKKVIDMFDSLKTSLKYGQVSRRSDFDQEETPQSSKVWERIIKNLNSRSARRSHVDGVPKSFQKLREMFDSVDISSNSYKDYLSLSRVPAASHLILLKVVQASVNQITSTLEKINLYMGSAVDLSKGEEFEIQRFLDNAAYSIDLNNKILEKLKTFKTKMDFEDSNNLKLDKFSVNKEFMQMPESDILQNPLQKIQAEKILSTVSGNVDELLHKIRSQNFGHSDSKNEMKPLSNYNKNMKNLEVVNHPESFKLTRDQVLNQLIKNRLQLYLQMKEVKIPNLNQDENYNLARRIMVRLENGNYSLAKELFKAFVANSESENLYRTLNNFEVSSLRNTEVMNTPVPDIIQRSRVKLEDYQEDNLLKQLVNLQTMNG